MWTRGLSLFAHEHFYDALVGSNLSSTGRVPCVPCVSRLPPVSFYRPGHSNSKSKTVGQACFGATSTFGCTHNHVRGRCVPGSWALSRLPLLTTSSHSAFPGRVTSSLPRSRSPSSRRPSPSSTRTVMAPSRPRSSAPVRPAAREAHSRRIRARPHAAHKSALAHPLTTLPFFPTARSHALARPEPDRG